VSKLKVRNRAIIFRVTEDEYKHLQKACSAAGGRSLADFARLRLLGAPGGESPAIARVAEKLDEVKHAVQQLTGILKNS
jgi:hypothetical protein